MPYQDFIHFIDVHYFQAYNKTYYVVRLIETQDYLNVKS
jgi:hypothetical protein